MTSSARAPAALSPEERERVLEILSFGAGTEGIETLIALLLLPNHGNSDARAKAARRTRLYKVRQILKQAPSSDNVMAACGYLVLESLTRAVGRTEIRDRLLSLLVEAGFDRGLPGWPPPSRKPAPPSLPGDVTGYEGVTGWRKIDASPGDAVGDQFEGRGTITPAASSKAREDSALPMN